jgi:hypothetical protein
MSDEGVPPLPSRPAGGPGGRLATTFGSLWKVLNSAIVIAVVSSIAVLFLTKWYEASQARSADLATRRADLERLLVELELRKDRLWVVCEQSLPKFRKTFTAQQQANNGERAMAIVSGRSDTVTSDPAYQNFHLATLLSQAELTAGLAPPQQAQPDPRTHQTPQQELMGFTDLTDQEALDRMPAVFDWIRDRIETLQTQLNLGQIPIPPTEHQARAVAMAVNPPPPGQCNDPQP